MKNNTREKIRFLGKILFVIYILFLLYFLLVTDFYGRDNLRAEYSYNLELFKEINRFWSNRDILGSVAVISNIAGNVLIFVPLGWLWAMASKHRNFITALFFTLLVSLGVEVIQLLTKIGSFDVDDLFLNTLGGCIGYIIFSVFCAIRRMHVSNKTKRKE